MVSDQAVKKWGVYPYVKPFGTPTGKAELISFYFTQKYEDQRRFRAAALGGIAGIYAA